VSLVVSSVSVDALKFDEHNARTHNKKNIDATAASLEKFGQRKPIVVMPDMTVIAGNGTLTAALKLGVAVNDRRKNQQTGEWEDSPNFVDVDVDVAVFGSRGEALARFLSKGSKVAIEGKLRWSQWENPQGEKRSKLEVVVDEIEFLSAQDGAGASAPSARRATPAVDLGDEIPF